MARRAPIPQDLLFFLREQVFPHAPREAVEAALSCSTVKLLAEGSEAVEPGLYIVYSGAVRVGDSVYERGDYFILEKGSRAVAERESIVIVVELRCGESLVRLAGPEACRVGDLVYRSPVTVSPDTPAIEAVRVMYRAGVSSVVVVDASGRPVGIFTDTDLRRLVATSRDLSRPIREYMTPNPFAVPPSTPCVDAVYRMMERNIKHLVIAEDGRLAGVVTVRDIAYAEALGPLYVRRIIDSADTVEGLVGAYRRLVRVLGQFGRRLHPLVSGGSVAALVRMASLALRSVVSRAARLAARRLGVEARGWAYIVLGSNARLEQAAPTDRDTALVYTSLSRSAAVRLAEEVEDILDRVGFPGCEHGYTARRLVFSLEELLEELRRAAGRPEGDREVVMLGLFLDAVDAYPEDAGLAARVRRGVVEAVGESGSAPYLRQVLAAYRPRLGLLGRLPERVDLKKHGLAPIVFAVKALSIGAGVWEPVPTIERLEALSARGIIPSDTAREVLEAYQILLGFSAWSLAVHGTRELRVEELSGVERSMLRSALQAAARLVDRARSTV